MPSAPSILRVPAEVAAFLALRFRSARLEGPPAPPKGRSVLVIPGFFASDEHTHVLREVLAHAGYRVLRWPFGRIRGVTDHTLDDICGLLDGEGEGSPTILVGWSLGGVFAREVAKQRIDLVSKVLTLGSPFSGGPRDNNAHLFYRIVSGHAVDDLPIEVDREVKPEVETIAFWSRRDGIVAPHSARGREGERDRAVEVDCSHVGFVHDEKAMRAILAELGG